MILELINFNLLKLYSLKYYSGDNIKPELPKDYKQMLRYCLWNTIGEDIGEFNEHDPKLYNETFLNLRFHYKDPGTRSYKVMTEKFALYEVRLAKKSALIDPYELLKNMKLQSWFYKYLNNIMPRAAPLSYHYRVLPSIEKWASVNYFPLQMFDVTEFPGDKFLEFIANQKKHYSSQNQNEKQIQEFKHNEDLPRGEIIPYLWGTKFSRFIQDFQQLHDDSFHGYKNIVLEGERAFGEAKIENCEEEEYDFYSTTLNEVFRFYRDLSFESESQTNLSSILLTKYEELSKSTKKDESQIEKIIMKLKKKLERVMANPTYKLLRKKESLRLSIEELHIDNLRIYSQNEMNITTLIEEFYTVLNPNEDRKAPFEKTKSQSGFCFAGITPGIYSKYWIAAQAILMINHELKISEKEFELPELSIVYKSFQEGFNKDFKYDKEDVEELLKLDSPFDFVSVEEFLGILLRLGHILKRLWQNFSLIDQIEKSSEERVLELRKLTGLKKQEMIEINQQIEKIERKKHLKIERKRIQNRNLKERLNYYLKLAIDLKLEFSVNDSPFVEREIFTNKVLIPRQKYFLPFLEKKVKIAQDQEEEDYNINLNEFDNREAILDRFEKAVFLKSAKNDDVQMRWFERKPFEISYQRKDEEKPKEGILVEKVKTAAQKLEEDAISKEILRFKNHIKPK